MREVHTDTRDLLGDLLAILLAPYDDKGAFSGRIRVSVPRMGVGEAAATTLALVVHELATNSLKYGALLVPTGTLDVACSSQEDVVVLARTERGGPAVTKPTGPGCYGSSLMTSVCLALDACRSIAVRQLSSQLGPVG